MDIIHLAKELGRHQIPEEEAAKIAALKLSENQSHNKGWYRIQATRKMTGGHRLLPAVKDSFKDVSIGTVMTQVIVLKIQVNINQSCIIHLFT